MQNSSQIRTWWTPPNLHVAECGLDAIYDVIRVKTITAVTAMCACLFNNRSPSYRHYATIRLIHECKLKQWHRHEVCWHARPCVTAFRETNIRWKHGRVRCHKHQGLLAMLQWTCRLHSASAAASFSHNLLFVQGPSQWWLRNHISHCRLAVEDAWTGARDTDNAAAWLAVCMFLSDYHKSHNRY